MARQPLALLQPAAPGLARVRRDKRALILDAAIKVFARKGYHGSRVSDIAREADIAYGLVYHYFTNKEEILRTIFEERWSGLRHQQRKAQRGRETEDGRSGLHPGKHIPRRSPWTERRALGLLRHVPA